MRVNNSNQSGFRYLIFLLAFLAIHIGLPLYAVAKYPDISNRKVSPGNTTYYMDAEKGNDDNSGVDKKHSWKTFKQVNRRIFSAGDRIVITGPADFRESLFLVARGSNKKHVKLVFEKGTYNFYPEASFKKQFFISNTNDDAYTPKAIAIYIDSSSYVDIEAVGAKMLMRGKMIETCIDHSHDIKIHGATYDYYRPTVSELEVIKTADNFADLKIHPDSKYSIKDSLLTWEGEGWGYNSISLWQVLDPATGHLQRVDINMEGLKYVASGINNVRVYFKRNPGFKAGLVYQNRDITRDCAGIFLVRSNNLVLKNIHINFMHGMGAVSQFCRNITIDSVFVKPAANSGRTCAAWADILHFSGCVGKISIINSWLSGANDDAVNVHGTYLRIIQQPQPNQLLVRFMHNQTFGFEAFVKGDSIAFVHSNSLLQYGESIVSKAVRVNDKDILLTLKAPLTDTIMPNDVVENITWTPRVYISNNTIERIPTRGILVTTRGKAVIENNIFRRVNNSAIAVADDAASWYESGMVKSLAIRNNKFYLCGGPVVLVSPENTQNNVIKVHNNILVTGNEFILLPATEAVYAKSTANIRVLNNSFKVTSTPVAKAGLIKFKDCTNTLVLLNRIYNR
ncbi:right-handed parallel beta-helix repeat-containing protein [Mucilaginibacter ginsenosidivorax]|uniref:Right-handed parallel beta-helix repeat-containing protein n=1 Tax=Mucilaginibacter ginsenosidivorax TaxID=862126 RepID=A0A5B8W7D1_9SPHI|nr:right-handed parallel beta-helix repeat-containing protein [Mucilaginibacter ginsenosidivorax]